MNMQPDIDNGAMENLKFGCITTPPRQSFIGSAAIVLVVAVMSATFVMPEVSGGFALVALGLLLAVALLKRYLFTIHIALLALLFLLSARLGGFFGLWPLHILTPLILYALIGTTIPALRETIGWFKRGRMDGTVTLLVGVTLIVSVATLVGWTAMMKPDLKHHLAQMPKLSFWVYPFAGAGFALLNALMEEAVFRGIVMEALDSALGAGQWAIGIQAFSFAALHYLAGFPNGVTGFIMTFLYGVMLGAIRRVSKGLLAPFLAHVAADLTIFSILLYIFSVR